MSAYLSCARRLRRSAGDVCHVALSGLLLYSDVPPPQHRSADRRPSGIERLAARIIISSQTPRFIVRRQRALNVFSRRCRRTLHKIARRAARQPLTALCSGIRKTRRARRSLHCPALVRLSLHANMRGHLNATMFKVNYTH